MNWNHDLSQAPRDGTHVILAMPNKTTLRSYWCEPKGEPAHWCMLSHKNEPVAWMAWPEHPFNLNTDAAISRPGIATLGRPEDENRSDEEAPEADASGGVQDRVRVHPATHFILEDVGGGA